MPTHFHLTYHATELFCLTAALVKFCSQAEMIHVHTIYHTNLMPVLTQALTMGIEPRLRVQSSRSFTDGAYTYVATLACMHMSPGIGEGLPVPVRLRFTRSEVSKGVQPSGPWTCRPRCGCAASSESTQETVDERQIMENMKQYANASLLAYRSTADGRTPACFCESAAAIKP